MVPYHLRYKGEISSLFEGRGGGGGGGGGGRGEDFCLILGSLEISMPPHLSQKKRDHDTISFKIEG